MRPALTTLIMTGTNMPGYLNHFAWLCRIILSGEGQFFLMPREFAESRWSKMQASVSEGNSVAVMAFMGNSVCGFVLCSVDKRLSAFWGVRIERILVKPRSDRERITRTLLEAASLHAGKMRKYPTDLMHNRSNSPCLTRRDLGFEVPLKSVYDPPRFWYPVEKPASPLDNTVINIRCYDLPLSLDFYCYKLGMSLMAFRHLGVFVNAGAIPIHLDPVDAFLRDEEPRVECKVLDIFAALADLNSRNIYIVSRGNSGMEKVGIFLNEDDSWGAVMRDPDGNFLALRQETMKSRMNNKRLLNS